MSKLAESPTMDMLYHLAYVLLYSAKISAFNLRERSSLTKNLTSTVPHSKK